MNLQELKKHFPDNEDLRQRIAWGMISGDTVNIGILQSLALFDNIRIVKVREARVRLWYEEFKWILTAPFPPGVEFINPHLFAAHHPFDIVVKTISASFTLELGFKPWNNPYNRDGLFYERFMQSLVVKLPTDA